MWADAWNRMRRSRARNEWSKTRFWDAGIDGWMLLRMMIIRLLLCDGEGEGGEWKEELFLLVSLCKRMDDYFFHESWPLCLLKRCLILEVRLFSYAQNEV